MWACNRQMRARGCTSHVHAMASVASVSQIYFSTVDNQHKTKAAVRVHLIFRRGAEFGSDLHTSKEPAGPKRVQLARPTNTNPIRHRSTTLSPGYVGVDKKDVESSNSTTSNTTEWWSMGMVVGKKTNTGDLKQNGHGPHMKFRGPMHEHICTST